jgi:lipoate-protein ligase A
MRSHMWRTAIQPHRLQQRIALFSTAPHANATIPPALPSIQVLRLDHLRLPVRAQLQIEEALLRGKHPLVTGQSFFLLNQPPPYEKAVVMGLSNKTELLVHLDAAERDGVQIVRRFSGGGTVYVDQQCWMVTMLIHKHEADGAATTTTNTDGSTSSSIVSSPPILPNGLIHPATLPPYPNKLMEWTRDFYMPVFGSARPTVTAHAADSSASSSPPPPSFSLTGHDYCFSSRKFGGNAQTITRNKWLHHTSFLWTLDSLNKIETYLRVPKKQPEYRAQRSHSEFLTSLGEVWQQVEEDRKRQIRMEHQSEELLHREPTDEHLKQFEQMNEPSAHPLFNNTSHNGIHSSMSTDNVLIPTSLSSRLLWRLSHYYQLEYPSLDSIADIVSHYNNESNTSVKILDYHTERMREIKEAEEMKIKEEQKIAAAVAASAAST